MKTWSDFSKQADWEQYLRSLDLPLWMKCGGSGESMYIEPLEINTDIVIRFSNHSPVREVAAYYNINKLYSLMNNDKLIDYMDCLKCFFESKYNEYLEIHGEDEDPQFILEEDANDGKFDSELENILIQYSQIKI